MQQPTTPEKQLGIVTMPRVRFLGEQDGIPERQLKERLARMFGDDGRVSKAYLAKVAYGDAQLIAVALCVRVRTASDKIVCEKVGRVFASMFSQHEHLDIIFISDTKESELDRLCKPFYTAVL